MHITNCKNRFNKKANDQKIKILLAFDHELSLGGSSSYLNDLFNPTDQLIELATKHGVPITLFTDILCAYRFKEWDKKGFFKTYCEQLTKTLKYGHDVQLHLHPHWLTSEFKNGSFIPSEDFSLSNFAEGKYHNGTYWNIPGIINLAEEFLTDLCSGSKQDYKCIAFRAGGFNLYPATEMIISALYEKGIRIDSSIAKNYNFSSNISEVDFHNMPSSANWYISKNIVNKEGSIDGLLEIPIAASPRTPINNLSFLVKRVLLRNRMYKANGWAIHEKNTSLIKRFKRLFPSSSWLLSFDLYTHSVNDLIRILDYHIRIHPEDEVIICSTCSHPKNMGKYSHYLMREFINRVSKYKNEVEFCSYQQIYDSIL